MLKLEVAGNIRDPSYGQGLNFRRSGMNSSGKGLVLGNAWESFVCNLLPLVNAHWFWKGCHTWINFCCWFEIGSCCLYSGGWPQTHSPALVSQMLSLQVCATTPNVTLFRVLAQNSLF